MKQLLIDSSSRSLYLEFTYPGFELTKISLITRDNDLWLSSVIKPLLPELMAGPTQIYLGSGPGSFTGSRVSYAYFKVLAQLTEFKFFSFNSLQLWHQLFDLSENSWFLSQLNSNMFYGFLPATKESWYAFNKEQLFKADFPQLLHHCGGKSYSDITVLANGVSALKELRPRLGPPWQILAELNDSYEKQGRRPKILGQINNGNFEVISENILTATPRYGHELEFYKKEKPGNG